MAKAQKVYATVLNNGVCYWLVAAKTKGEACGFAPVKVRQDLDKILLDYTPEQVTILVNRQLCTDGINKVRTSGTKPSSVEALLKNGMLTPDKITLAAAEFAKASANGTPKAWVECCLEQCDEQEAPDGEKVHWDCVL